MIPACMTPRCLTFAVLAASPLVLAFPATGQQNILIGFSTAGGTPGVPAIADVHIAQGQLPPFSTSSQEASTVGLALPMFNPAWGSLNAVSLEIAPQVLNTWEITIGGGSGEGHVTSNVVISLTIPQTSLPDITGLLFTDSWGNTADGAAVGAWVSSTTQADAGADYQIDPAGLMDVGPIGSTSDYTGVDLFSIDMMTTVTASLSHNRFNHGGGDRDHHAEIAPVSTNVAAVEYNFDSTSLLAGDVNLDGQVDIEDLGIVNANFGLASGYWNQGDVNQDGQVGSIDRGIVKAGIVGGGRRSGTRTSAVPEPGSFALFVLGGWVINRRRR